MSTEKDRLNKAGGPFPLTSDIKLLTLTGRL